MDTARCRAFVASVKHGSFSKAAEELNYTTSGVSQLVTALEEDLKITLLHRTRKGVTMTADGERMYNVIYNFVKQEEQIYQMASDISGLLVGEIVIAAFPSICSAWLPNIIRRFKEIHPGVEFRIDDGIRDHVMEALRSGRADIGFLSDHHDLTGEFTLLERNPMVAMVSYDSPYAAGEVFPLADCEKADLIQHSRGHDLDMDSIYKANHLKPNIVYTTRNSSTAAAMAEQNMGILMVNELSTHMWHYNLKVLPLDPPQYTNLGMVVSVMSNASPAVKAFVRFVRETFRERGDKSQK